MAKSKVKGLIDKSSIQKGLVGQILHHTDSYKLSAQATMAMLQEKDVAEVMRSRGTMLEQDIKTMYGALKEILEIAKARGYEDIRQILEEREYEHGHDWK